MPLFDPSSVPSADEVNKVHTNSDVDKSRLSQHHTLGTSATQASPGNHNHDGISSVKIKTTDLEGTIPGALPAGGLADQVLTKIDGTDYNVEWSDATAITTTANLIKHYVKNDSGTTLAKGTVVYVSGANGTNILVKPALATSDATTATTIGFLQQTLASNAHGYVVSEGLLTGLNTSAANAGDPMWLSGTTAGTVIYGLANEPHAPVHIVYLGTVTRAHSNNGEIFIKVNNGWELQELHNVDALTPSNGDLLKYDSATSLWKNSAQSTLAIAPSQVTGTAVITTDSRLSDARTPTAHASTHASAGSDPVTLAQSQVTNLTTDLANKASSTHVHGNISNTGTVSTSVTATNPVKVLITDTSNIVGTLTTTGASNTTFLRGDGTWQTAGGSFTGGTLTSNLTLDDGTITSAPLNFVSGVNLTTPVAGAVEYDGTVFYETPNATSGRALNPATYYYTSSATWNPDFSTTSTAKSLLGAATRGITVSAGTTYAYELQTAIRQQFVTTAGVSATYVITSSTVSGSPVVGVVHYVNYGSNTTDYSFPTTLSSVRTTSSITSVVPAVSSGSRYATITAKGIIRVTGTGTTKIYPSISTTATSGDNVWTVNTGTTFVLTPIGNGTVTQVGTWA